MVQNSKIVNNIIHDNNTKNANKNSILIIDTGADQSTVGGNAWIKVYDTGNKIKCNSFYQGKDSKEGPTVPVMLVITCMETPGEEPILLLFHQTCFIEDSAQYESFCLPFQCMDHGVTFDLMPKEHQNDLGQQGRQSMTIEDREIPLNYDGRKMYVDIRKPTEEELATLEVFKLTSSEPYEPKSSDNNVLARDKKSKLDKLPGGISLERWQN